jgi:hypothetical protein
MEEDENEADEVAKRGAEGSYNFEDCSQDDNP